MRIKSPHEPGQRSDEPTLLGLGAPTTSNNNDLRNRPTVRFRRPGDPPIKRDAQQDSADESLRTITDAESDSRPPSKLEEILKTIGNLISENKLSIIGILGCLGVLIAASPIKFGNNNPDTATQTTTADAGPQAILQAASSTIDSALKQTPSLDAGTEQKLENELTTLNSPPDAGTSQRVTPSPVKKVPLTPDTASADTQNPSYVHHDVRNPWAISK